MNWSLLCITLCLVSVAAGRIDRHVVPCGVQQRVCECRQDADECEFTLVIEELQTFVSYKIEEEVTFAGETVDRGTPNYSLEEGTPYYLNASGFLQSGLDADEIAACQTKTEQFNTIKCTVPQTVDGKTYRPYIGVNGLVPGPTLIVSEEQVMIVNVDNRLVSETTSIHWHGLDQRNTPWMDGALLISQCPISPGETFRYYFKAAPTGTYWYHSHRVTQRMDGLFGALIIKESTERIQTLQNRVGRFIDDPARYTINLHEWNQETMLDLYNNIKGELPFYLEKPIGEVPLPTEQQVAMGVAEPYEAWDEDFSRGPDGLTNGDLPFWSGLINGKGRHSDVPYNQSRLEIFTVDEGNSYRFRLIGSQGLYGLRFSVDEHNLTVISTDGSLIEPIPTQFIILHTGERYDFILTANRPRSNVNDYWIRAETLEVNLDSPGPPYPSKGNMAEAILHYSTSASVIQKGDKDTSEAGVSIPIPRSTEYEQIRTNSIPFDVTRCATIGGCTAINCPFEAYHSSYNIQCINAFQFRMFEDIPNSTLPDANPDPNCNDCELFFNIGSDNDSINGRNMVLPQAPLQTQKSDIFPSDFCNIDRPCPNGESCSCVHVRDITTFNGTIRFVLSSIGNEVSTGDGFAHPIHLHGHHFQVIAMQYGRYNQSNGFLLSRREDLVCDDSLCSSPGWSGSSPIYPVNRKAVLKDTILVPAGGYAVVQFRSDNPGFWFMHCHIVPDLLEGMAVAINEVEKRQNPPPEGTKTCGDYRISQSLFYEKLAFDPDSSSVKKIASFSFVFLCSLLAWMSF